MAYEVVRLPVNEAMRSSVHDVPIFHTRYTHARYSKPRLNNLLAALGRAQLARLDGMITRRRALRDRYKGLFANVPGVSIFGADGDERDNAWLTAIGADEGVTGWSATDLSAALAAENIESRPIWKPMHLQPVFADARTTLNGTSEALFDTHITLPSGSALSTKQQDRVLGAISKFLGA